MKQRKNEAASSPFHERNERVMPSSFYRGSAIAPQDAAKRDSREVAEKHGRELRELLSKLTHSA